MDPKMDPKIVSFLGTVFEVPKSIDFGPKIDRFGGPKGDILGTLSSKSLDTCPHGKHISETYQNKEREAR
jgi:hypothetical protein